MVKKHALVTGAGGRLGRAMSVYLAKRGYDVAVHYSGSQAGAEETVHQVKACGQNAQALQADFLDQSAIETLIERASSALCGPLTVLINNASIFEYDRMGSATLTSWDRHLSTNLRAPFFLTQSFASQAPKAQKDPQGATMSQALVVNMLDQRVKKPTPEFITYSLAKQALWGLTITSAQALAPHVRVNGIAPGSTIIGARQTKEHFEAQRSNSLLNRGPNPSDICDALGYFLEAPAVTGQMLAVDGGQHLGWKTPDIIGISSQE